MPGRVFAFLAVMVLALPARAADEKVQNPTLTLRVKGLDELLADVRYLAEQAGRGEELRQAEGLLKSMTGEKGLEGLDTKRPMALYGYLGGLGIDSDVVLMLPIADQKVFQATLERVGVKSEKEKGDIYKTQPPGSPVPAYYRFANNYVYAALRDPAVLGDARLLRPATVLPAAEKSTISLSLDLSIVPKNLRDLVITQLDQQLGALREKQPGETQAQADFRTAVLTEGVSLFKSLLTDSNAVTLRFGVDRKTDDVAVSLGLAGKAGSELSKRLASWGQGKSVVGGVIGDDSAMASRVTLEAPEKVRKEFARVIDEAVKKMLEDIKEQEAREVAEPLVKAIAPSLKAGKLDLALDFRGPSEKKTYTVVAAVAGTNGQAIEKELKAALKKVPQEVQNLIEVDAAKSGTVNIHKVNIGQGLDAEARKNLGDEWLYFAVREDALFLAVGEGGLAALKDAVKIQPKAAPLMQVDMSMQRLAALMAAQQKAAPQAAREAFGKNRGLDNVHLQVQGGNELRLQLGFKGPVLKFFNLLDQAEKKDQ